MTAPDELTPNTLRELAENEYVPTAVAVAMNMLASAWDADRKRIEALEKPPRPSDLSDAVNLVQRAMTCIDVRGEEER